MRLEVRWALAAAAAMSLGVMLAAPYARLIAPYYGAVDRLIATGRPWEILSVDVRPGKTNLSEELELWAFVRRDPQDRKPAAKVVGRVQIGEAVETPVVFWTLLLAWPAASRRQRAKRLLIGVPIFMGLEAITTACQLILPMAQASAMLGGEKDPVTAWDHWSRFLEAGGQFVVICGGAILAIAVADAYRVPTVLQ
jgi:hypothetical protein